MTADTDAVTSTDITSASRPERIPGGRGGTITPFTAERASAVRRAAVERNRQVAKAALRKAALDAVPGITEENASHWSLVFEAYRNHSLNFMDPSARGSAASGRLLLGALIPEPERIDHGTLPAPGGAVLHLSPDQLDTLLAELRDKRQSRVSNDNADNRD